MIRPTSSITRPKATQTSCLKRDSQSPQPFENGHSVHRITASRCSVEGNIASIIPRSTPSNPVSFPSLFVRHARGKVQPFDEQAHVSCKVTSPRNICCQEGTHLRELAEVNIYRGQILPCRIELTCGTDEFISGNWSKKMINRTAGPCINTLADAELFKSNLRPMEGRDVNRRKDRIYPSTGKVPPDCWNGKRGENTKHRPNTRPCIPVNCAGATEVPALADAIQNAHSVIPLWTRRHSATPWRVENYHG